jgi:hypothetical protein
LPGKKLKGKLLEEAKSIEKEGKRYKREESRQQKNRSVRRRHFI